MAEEPRAKFRREALFRHFPVCCAAIMGDVSGEVRDGHLCGERAGVQFSARLSVVVWRGAACRADGRAAALLLALLLLVLLDYITGICVAIQTKQLSSQIGAKGITKKVAMFVVIAFCHVLDAYLLHAEAALETVSTIFYLSNEGISILENVGKLGVPLPQKVQTLLSYLKKSGDNDPPS